MNQHNLELEFVLNHFETTGTHNGMKSEWFIGSQQFKMPKRFDDCLLEFVV